MSIHKSQGMTIDSLVVDLTGAFADGQVIATRTMLDTAS